MEIFNIVILSLSALLLLFVGISRLTNPIKTYEKSSGIQLTNDVNLLNEVRGVSALMVCGGVIIGLGIIVSQLTLSSSVVGSLIFIGFAIGRVISMGVDGKPNKQLISGLVFELVLGSLNVYGLISSLG